MATVGENKAAGYWYIGKGREKITLLIETRFGFLADRNIIESQRR